MQPSCDHQKFAPTTKRILLFSCEPGGAEVLIPLVKLIRAAKGLEPLVFGYGHALERFERNGIECRQVPPVVEEDSALLEDCAPACLITSASSLPEKDMSEKHLWRQARRKGIKSLAMLDQWQNYVARFSGRHPEDRLAYLPDYINCLNETGKREMLYEGFPESILIPLGHPYLTQVMETLPTIDGAKTKRTLGITQDEKVALFVSEPIREHYGRRRGYDEYQALKLFLDGIDRARMGIQPVIKLHPKDEHDKFESTISRYRHLAPLVIAGELNAIQCIAMADVVVGMTSIMLIEAYVIGKAVVSLQPHLSGPDPLVLSRHGFIPKLSTEVFFNPLEFSHTRFGEFDFHFRAEEFLVLLQSVLQKG